MLLVPGIPEGLEIVRYGKRLLEEVDLFCLSSGGSLNPVVPMSNQEYDCLLVKPADGYVIEWNYLRSFFAVSKKFECPIEFTAIAKTEYDAELLQEFSERHNIQICSNPKVP